MGIKYFVVVAAMTVILIGVATFATDSAFEGEKGMRKSGNFTGEVLW